MNDGSPAGSSRRDVLSALAVALQRDSDFLSRHPTALFQSLWNHLRWQSAGFHRMLRDWHRHVAVSRPGEWWLRSLEPPPAGYDQRQKLVLRGHAGERICLAFSPDARWLATGCIEYGSGDPESRDVSARIWDLENGTPIAQYDGHTYGVWAIAFSPDGTLVATLGIGNDRTLHVWRAQTAERLLTLRCSDRDGFQRCAFSSDSSWVGGVSYNAIYLSSIHAESRGRRSEAKLDYEATTLEGAVRWSDLSERDLLARLLGKPLLVSAGAATMALEIPERGSQGAAPEWIRIIGYADAKRVTVDAGVQIQSESIPGRRLLRFRRVLGALYWCRQALHLPASHTPRRASSVGHQPYDVRIEGEVVIITPRAEGGTPVRLRGHQAAVREYALSSSGSLLATSSTDGSVIVWNLRSDQSSNGDLILGGVGPECHVTVSNLDRTYRPVVRGNEWLQLLDPSGQLICEIPPPQLFITGSADRIPSRAITAVALTMDDSKLAFAQYSRGIVVWDLARHPPEYCRSVLPDHIRMEMSGSEVALPEELSFSADGRRLAGARRRPNAAHVWDVATGRCLRRRTAYIDPVVAGATPTEFPFQLTLNRLEIVAEARDSENPVAVAWLPFAESVRADPESHEWLVGEGNSRRRFALVQFGSPDSSLGE